MFQCDSNQFFQYIEGEYCWHLNSDDLHDPELPLTRSRSHGGTAALWQKNLDPYVEIISTTTTAFLPIVLKMPGLRTAIHIAIYMPTSGKDNEFVADLAELRNCLDDLSERYANAVIYIRGDGNVNHNNRVRVTLLRQLIMDYKLNQVEIGHSTYHHFMGGESHDSAIDILLYSSCDDVTEKVEHIMCIHNHPELLSHHDVIFSSFTIPCEPISSTPGNLVTAPRCNFSRNKIYWSVEGQAKYAELVTPYLREARNNWLDSNCQASMSVLLSVTNKIMSKCATLTNQSKDIVYKNVRKSRKVPRTIKNASDKMIAAH